MPLSEHEQRLLEQIESALYAEDPKFASIYQGTDVRSHYRKHLIQAIVVLVIGLGGGAALGGQPLHRIEEGAERHVGHGLAVGKDAEILAERGQEGLVRCLDLIDAGEEVFEQEDAAGVSMGDGDNRGVGTHELDERIDLRSAAAVANNSGDGRGLTLRECRRGQGGGGQNRTGDLDELLSHC